jgi:hypothetical protein
LTLGRGGAYTERRTAEARKGFDALGPIGGATRKRMEPKLYGKCVSHVLGGIGRAQVMHR